MCVCAIHPIHTSHKHGRRTLPACLEAGTLNTRKYKSARASDRQSSFKLHNAPHGSDAARRPGRKIRRDGSSGMTGAAPEDAEARHNDAGPPGEDSDAALERDVNAAAAEVTRLKLEAERSAEASKMASRIAQLERDLEEASVARAAADAEVKLLREDLTSIKERERAAAGSVSATPIAGANAEAGKNRPVPPLAEEPAAAQGRDSSGDLAAAFDANSELPSTPAPGDHCSAAKASVAAIVPDTPFTSGANPTGMGGVASPSHEDTFNLQIVQQVQQLMAEKAALQRRSGGVEREAAQLREQMELMSEQLNALEDRERGLQDRAINESRRAASAEAALVSLRERAAAAEAVAAKVVEMEMQLAGTKVELAESVYQQQKSVLDARQAKKRTDIVLQQLQAAQKELQGAVEARRELEAEVRAARRARESTLSEGSKQMQLQHETQQQLQRANHDVPAAEAAP